MSKVSKLIDKLWVMKLVISADEKKLKAKKEKYNEGKDKIINEFSKDKIQGLKGSLAQVSIIKTDIPIIEDQNKFFKYVFRNKAVDLLKNGISTKAYRERIEAGKKIPGVSNFCKITLRVSKVK